MKTVIHYECDDNVGRLNADGSIGDIIDGIAQMVARVSYKSSIPVREIVKVVTAKALHVKHEITKGDNK